MKNIIVAVINLISVMTRNFKGALIERTKSVSEMFFLKKSNEKNIEKLFDVRKDNLFYNIVTQQFRRNDVRETYNNKRQMKSFFKVLMIKLK